MKIGIAFLALIVAAGALVSPADAQELTSGTLAGKVTDPAGKPIPGAVIIATSQHGTRTAETDANGNYVLPFLRPGTYNVRVEAPGGFNVVIQNDVSVGLNQRTNLNFTLEPGKTETVTVTAASPLVDYKSTSSGTNLKYDEFANAVPLGRSFTDTFAVAPGVVSGLGTGQGNYSVSGSSGLENSYLIDGVNITNTGYGGIGSYNIIYGSLGTGVTSEFLDEVQVKTAGFEAEYGQALGGIINTIVKSGTNEFKGNVTWFSKPGGFRSSNQLVELDAGAANVIAEQENDFAFSVSGPIVKDKFFYFVSFNPVITTRDVRAQSILNPAFIAGSDVSCGGPGCVTSLDESMANGFGAPTALAFPSAGLGTLEGERQSNNYAAKFTWQVSPKHQVDLTFFGDPSKGDRGPQRDLNGAIGQALSSQFAIGGGASEIEYGHNSQSLKWNAVFTPRFFMEAQIAHKDGEFREDSVLNEIRYRDRRNVLEFFRGANSYDPGTGPIPLELQPVEIFRGGVGFISNQDDEDTTYQIKLTNVLGKHEIKYGIQYDDISYRDTSTYTGPSINLGLPISFPGTLDPVDGDANGVQDFINVPTNGGVLVDVRNQVGGDPLVAYDSSNRYRVVRSRIGPRPNATKAEELGAFIQDTWTIHPRVTIKAGVRWTQETIKGAGTFTLPFGTEIVTDGFGIGHRIYTCTPDGSGGCLESTTFSPSDYTFGGNWAPRVGVTWDVLGNGRSRVWANWGRYFERVPNDLAVRSFSNEVGVSRQEFTDRVLATPRTIGGGTCVDNMGMSPAACNTSAAVFTQGVDQTEVVAGTKLPFEDELSGGFAFEISPNSAFEVRAIYRTQGRVLEDVQVNAIEQIQNFYYGPAYSGGYYPYEPFGGTLAVPNSTTFPAAIFGPYVMANPGTDAVPTGGVFGFPKPTRRYKALELIYTRRFSDNWSVYANYRFARLIGNYEGLFRNDNGQSDPNITSLWDFPASPLLSGQFISGTLPADTSHVMHIYPSYQFANKLRLGANFTWASGVPRTSMLAHPIYQNAGEIPGINPEYGYWVDTGGAGNSADFRVRRTTSLKDALTDLEAISGAVFLVDYDPVKRGNLGRTPDTVTLDLHADYPLQMGKTQISFFLDVFNIFQTQEAILFEDTVELTAGVLDPDFLKPIAYQNPRAWRLGARWNF